MTGAERPSSRSDRADATTCCGERASRPRHRAAAAASLAALAGLVLAACAANPHADYFVVDFRPGTGELSEMGRRALANAADAARGAPLVVVEGVASEEVGPEAQGLVRVREKRVTQVLGEAGVASAALRVENRSVAAGEFARRQDSLIIKVAHGVRPPS
jgi:hypothetical protein